MQALALHYGGNVEHASIPVHGKQSMVSHTNTKLFKGVPNPFGVGRYHSLIVGDLPLKVAVTASINEIPMGMECKEDNVQGVQFHPESILTPKGQKIVDNWIEMLSSFQ